VAESIVAVHYNLALCREQQAPNKLKQRRLACTVRSQQRNPFAFFDLQAYRLKSRDHAAMSKRVQ